MHPFAITDQNPNDLYGVPGCSFTGQQSSNDCAGQWFVVPTQHVRVANPLAPHICVCAYHLGEALKATGPHDDAGVDLATGRALDEPAKPARTRRPRGKPIDDISL